MPTERYLGRTRLLDFGHPALSRLVEERRWRSLPEYERIGAVYRYVQNEIAFGYNASDEIPASEVLHDGYGQCTTKGTLLMALLRSVGVPCRFHAFTIDKRLQKGAISGLAYRLAPANIIHSWVEVYHAGKWLNLEGFILDRAYLSSVQNSFPEVQGAFCGYGIATSAFQAPPVEWRGSDTYIQKDGINRDWGVFDAPDEFYAVHGANLGGVRKVIYKRFVSKWINANVHKIRKHGVARQTGKAA